MTNGRKLRAAVATATLALTSLTCTTLAAPAQADPSIGDVQSRVDHLYRQAEKASERYNNARLDLQQAHSKLTALQLDMDRQRQRVADIREEVVATVVAQYQGQPLSTAAQVMLDDDPDQFLTQLTTISQYSSERSATVDRLAVEVDRLELRENEMRAEVADISRSKAALAREKATIHHKAGEAKKLLSRLKEQARQAREAAAERASRSESRAVPTAAAPASGSAATAVQFAMAQVGDAYVWGAAGPDAYDCSGLTMAAWGAAGVSLPHSSSAQMGYGTPVSISALQPGDLVFYYSPVSHVAMYIGNGMIVHAANPSQGVRVDPVGLMPISGAVRPG